jgi:hypothetical protein
MWLIKITLTSESFQIRLRESKRVKLLRALDFSLMFLILILYVVIIQIIFNTDAQSFFKNNETEIGVFALVLSCSLSLTNLTMFIVFIRIFLFFLNYRAKMQNQQQNSLSTFNKLIISFVIFICSLVLLHINLTVMQGIVLYVHGTEYLSCLTTIYFLDPMYGIVLPIKDFLTALGFVFLYYHQGTKKKDAEFDLDDKTLIDGGEHLNNKLNANITTNKLSVVNETSTD